MGKKVAEAVVVVEKATKGKEAKKAEKVVLQRDKWNSREGTRCWVINALITKTPKKCAVIEEEAKKEMPDIQCVRNHLDTLSRKGLIVKSGDGYSLPAEKKARKAG